MRKRYIILVFSLLPLFTWAQNLGIAQWQDELPYSSVIKIENAGDIIYGATPYSLFTFDKDAQIMQRYSTINGLSDVGIKTISYNPDNKILLIAYNNTNIDLMKENGSIVNMPDIKRAQILGNKTINDVFFHQDMAYISCGFGIVVIDIIREEVKDTWLIGEQATNLEVFDIEALGDSLYAATEKGIMSGHLTADNLADFNNWHQVQTVPNYSGAFTNIVNFNNKLVVSYHPEEGADELYAYNNNQWTRLIHPQTDVMEIDHLCVTKNELFALKLYCANIYNLDLQYQKHVYTYGEGMQSFAPTSIFLDKNDKFYWISDLNNGLLRTHNFWDFTPYQLNGPFDALIYDMDAKGDRLVVTPGGRKESTINNWNRNGVYTKYKDRWTSLSSFNTPPLENFYDFVGVSINPLNHNQYAAGSWNEGVAIFDENGFVAGYDEHNSTLSPVSSTDDYVRIGDVVYDKEGNLWANCAGTPKLMHRLSPDGKWTDWNLGTIASKDVGDMSIDSRGYKWMRLRVGSGYFAFVFDEKQTEGNQLKGISGSAGQGNVPGSQLWCVTEDLDGEIWLGTDQGIGVIYTPSNIFNGGNFDAQTIIVEHEDGYARPLLQSEQVNDIKVDGANRKWIATEKSGVFLISPDGLEEIKHFTTENSPLYSNTVKKISISDNGTVYMGTAQGIIAYRSEATPASETYTDVYAYPNPVRPDYHGPIAIKGLIQNAKVKITSEYGHLVAEMEAYGGQAIWDGKDLQNKRVQTGVYLIFLSDDMGEETMVSKILFIN